MVDFYYNYYVCKQIVDQEQTQPNHLVFSFLKKKSQRSGDLLADAKQQISEIEKGWKSIFNQLQQQVNRSNRYYDAQEDEAYQRCKMLLDEQYETEEHKFKKVMRKIKVALQASGQRIQLTLEEIQKSNKDIEKLKDQIAVLEAEQTGYQRKHKKKDQLHQQIQHFIAETNSLTNKLENFKEKSYEQKDLYLQSQQYELQLLEKMRVVEEEDQIYAQFSDRENRYKKLSGIIEKLKTKKQYNKETFEETLREKINEMALLRTRMKGSEEILEDIDRKIEQQNYVVEGLTIKAQKPDIESQILEQYHKKYQELYFSNGESKNWRNYQEYLKELIKQDRMGNFLAQQPRYYEPKTNKQLKKYPFPEIIQEEKQMYRYDSISPEERQRIINEISPKYKVKSELQGKKTPSPVSRFSKRELNDNSKIYPQNKQKHSSSVILPKIVKMTGAKGSQNRIKEKLKADLKPVMGESDFSLESVSSDGSQSGQLIEVEFHKKN